MPAYFTLVTALVSGVLAGTSQLRLGRSFLGRSGKAFFLLSIGIVFGLGLYITFLQYQAWHNDPLAKLLLPPHQSSHYFISYSLTHFFAPYLISLLIALLFLWVGFAFNRRVGGIFFEKGEPYLAAVSLFLTGHPGWLVYLIILIVAYLLFHLINLLRRSQTNRLPLYRFWATVAFFVILTDSYWLIHIGWWPSLNF